MQVKINKRSAYAPLRYEATRPYAVLVGKSFVREALRGDAARTKFIQGALFETVNTALAKMSVSSGPGPAQAEIVNVQLFGHYQHGGKVIFDVSKPLVQALRMTDAEDIPCGELAFPSDSFYLHFGSDSGLTDDGLCIEGAFVTRMDDRMTIDLVPQSFGQPHFFALPMGDATVGAHIVLSDPSKSVARSLDESIEDVLANNAKVFEQIAVFERQLTEQYGGVVKVPLPTERLAEKEPLLRKALGLIVNTMFYLAAEPEDVVEDWGRETPVEALQALGKTEKPGTKKTIENTLVKAGYTKVRFIGRRFSDSVIAGQIHEAMTAGKTLSTHFRRGHFRRQPYGPERALRKTIFVAPLIVNAGGASDQQGRIYKVD